MADALFLSPLHPRKDLSRFAEMSEKHNYHTGGAKKL